MMEEDDGQAEEGREDNQPPKEVDPGGEEGKKMAEEDILVPCWRILHSYLLHTKQ